MTMDIDRPPLDDTETAGAIVRPPFLFLGALVLGLIWDRLLPLPFPVPGADLAHWIVGGALILAGVVPFVTGVRGFSRAGTPVQGYKPTTALVTTGIYRWTRNPIYVGMFLIYCGIGLAAQSPWVLLIVVPLVIVMRYGVVAREEAYLERRFGDEYRAYKARVRRWL